MKTEKFDVSTLKLESDAAIFLDITDNGEYSSEEHSPIVEVNSKRPFKIPAKHIAAYRKDAKRILDAESKSLNKEGIKRLLAALLIEVMGNGNFGKEN